MACKLKGSEQISRKILIAGKTGNGKSSLGNSLLGESPWPVLDSTGFAGPCESMKIRDDDKLVIDFQTMIDRMDCARFLELAYLSLREDPNIQSDWAFSFVIVLDVRYLDEQEAQLEERIMAKTEKEERNRQEKARKHVTPLQTGEAADEWTGWVERNICRQMLTVSSENTKGKSFQNPDGVSFKNRTGNKAEAPECYWDDGIMVKQKEGVELQDIGEMCTEGAMFSYRSSVIVENYNIWLPNDNDGKKLCVTGTSLKNVESYCDQQLDSVSKQDGPYDEDAEEEIRALEQLLMCKVCLDKDSCIVFFPCRHMATCEACERFLQRCPVCRSPIDEAVKLNEE